MATKLLRTKDKMNLIYELKKMGIPKSDVEEAFRNRGLKPPTKPTIRKYYNMDEKQSTAHMAEAYVKEKAFDNPLCKDLIIRTLNVNGTDITVSSIYDLLLEKLVDEKILQKLPGNEQTLRNYCHYLKKNGFVKDQELQKSRIYDEVETPEPGLQIQLDYGVQNFGSNEQLHFIGLLLRHSRMLFVKGQDHRFNATESCAAIYAFFMLLGGRVKELVIDQDACLVYEEKYGEVTTTRVFKDFLVEQDLQLFVCRKADPATKGPVENSIKYVKQNYLPSRKDWSIQKLIEKLPDWCKRKNSRIHTKELWKIDDHFQKYEKGALRSLNPSQYDRIGSARIKVSVTKTRQARFRTNRYVLPRDYCENYVWMHVTSTKIMFYTTPEAHTPVCCYDLPSEKVKNQLYEHQEFKKRPSTAYKDIYERIVKEWYAPELKHFLNELHKEHENSRFLRDQFMGLEKLLHDRKPSQEELSAVMDIACRGYLYKLSQLKESWDIYRIHQEQKTNLQKQDILLAPAQSEGLLKPRYTHEVEKRDTSDYAQMVVTLAEVQK